MTVLTSSDARGTSEQFSVPVVGEPRMIQAVRFAVRRRTAMRTWIRRYGRVFELDIPLFGRTAVISDPAAVKAVFAASAERLVNVQPNLSNLFGPGSVFGLDGEPHRQRRRLLASAFHGRSLRDLEKVVEEETVRESSRWPEGKEFRILEPMNRISLNVILRTVFGADGSGADELRAIIPPFMTLGSLVAFVTAPSFWRGRHSPWGALNRFRGAYDRVVLTLIDEAETDPELGKRTDVLALLVRSSQEGRTQLSRADICDELLALIGAGHETTASALAWTFERLRRHPALLADLVAEIDERGSALRRATIAEALRARTVLDVAGRRVNATDLELGGWRIPSGRTVLVRIADLHESPELFPDPERFDPYRFVGAQRTAPGWQAFGGGERRCPGADFAIVEMDVVLRTVLRMFRLQTDDAPDEKSHFRGVSHTPKRGARVILTRRRQVPC
ncbi:cytochrome P450 [Mycobacterium sp. GA-2829]|uniref:cytochrome P450 n=1 Tax=Mycobacterium sp. GA-2829 TaxID=1772283 RepID=UPI000740180B|nr:cytochrome P450 [Mycobacterium sp. GA-2829]KUI36625.1 cytochrome P450 [Mycobacterium sp. GA-2829]